MNWPHWIIVPIVLPLFTGALLILLEQRRSPWVMPLSISAMAMLAAVCVALVGQAHSGQVQAYLVSNWAAPFGIALALDRLSALMLMLVAGLGLCSLLYACGGDDRRGTHFHALFHFQLMGINGAFLTADLFNLFVFFEVLLAASYGLLLHGAGAARVKSSVHYVVFNLIGGALFLIAVSLLYGLTGTLNMADLAVKVPQLGPDKAALAQTAGLLLLVVFAVKGALLPLYFWLPSTYGAATAPVAALFAILTKVGVYAIARMYTLVFGADAQGFSLAHTALLWLALGTLLLAAIGLFAAQRMRSMVGYWVISSAGTLLIALGLNTPVSVSAGLLYLLNSTLATALLFLVADRVIAQREAAHDALLPAAMHTRMSLGLWFLLAAIAASGVPPLAGFFGKAWLLNAAAATPQHGVVWSVVLVAALLMVMAAARAGSQVFWKTQGFAAAPAALATPTQAMPAHTLHSVAMALAGAGIVATTVLAHPISAYTQAAAAQLFERTSYIQAVLQQQPVPPAWDIRLEMREHKAKEGAP
jgi:multicomponent K+:H+ antiporter subunit D